MRPRGIVERDAELVAIADVLDAALAGSGRMLLVEGAAGLGKTTLLTEAMREARERRMPVLRATGAHTERDHPFGVMRQALEPRLSRAAPAERELLLAGSARLAEIVLRAEIADPHAVQPVQATWQGLFWLLANIAEKRPVLVCVDDAQWADAASLRFLLYLARRVADVPVAVVVAARPSEPGADAALLAELAAAGDRVLLRPLSDDAIAQLLAERFESQPATSFVRACAESSGGNPFLLSELSRELASAGVAPVAEAADRISRIRPSAVAQAVLLRLSRLPPQAAELARAVAVLERGPYDRVVALAGVPRPEADPLVDALVAAEILVAGDVLRFAHPLLREVVHGEIPPRERARRHAAAAVLLAEAGARAEEVAAQVLATDAPVDERVAGALERAAGEALAVGAPDTAVACLTRLATVRAPTPGMLLQRGSAHYLAGHPDRAATDLEAALAAAGGDVALLVEAARALAPAQMALGRYDAAVETFERALAAAPADDELALRLEGDLAVLLGIARGPAALERLERFAGLEGRTPGERAVLAMLALRRATTGPITDAMPLVRRALAGDRLLHETRWLDAGPFLYVAPLLSVAGEHDESTRLLDEAIASVRRQGSVFGFAIVSAFRALAAHLRGDVRRAEAEAAQALRAAREAGWEVPAPLFVTVMLQPLIARGALQEAQRVLEETGTDGDIPVVIAPVASLLAVRAELRLAQRRPQDALADAARAEEIHGRLGAVARHLPNNARPAAVRARLTLGDVEGACRVAAHNLEIAQRFGERRPLGVALHHAGLAEARPGLIADAVAVLETCGAPLELSHALTDLGAALRRARSVTEARKPLRRACDIAARCGADALAERADDELAATGVRRRRAGERDELTPSELRIAELAAEGLTNKQIAQTLFVTLKTVESHLGSAYRKLGIGSRAEIAGALRGRDRASGSVQGTH